jgi:hypothetical protein
MACYKDKSFCASPRCINACGRKITRRESLEAIARNEPIAYAYFCDLPDDFKQSIKENKAPE